MTKAEMIKRLHDACGLTNAAAEKVLDECVSILKGELQKGEAVVLPGFGKFSVKNRAARSGRNPRTGETLTIPACKVVGFTPLKQLRDVLNSK